MSDSPLPTISSPLNVPIAVKPAPAYQSTAAAPPTAWKTYILVGALGIAVGGIVVYLILNRKKLLPWVGTTPPVEENRSIEVEKQQPQLRQPTPPAAPFGSGKRWTPVEALK